MMEIGTLFVFLTGGLSVQGDELSICVDKCSFLSVKLIGMMKIAIEVDMILFTMDTKMKKFSAKG
jgi:hypothetical protein